MRRILLILLAFVLPAQFAWAVTSTYCGHETTVVKAHWGHHEHEHKAASVVDADPTKIAPATIADMDCGVCHFSMAQPLPSTKADYQPSISSGTPLEPVVRYGSHIPALPERPDISFPL